MTSPSLYAPRSAPTPAPHLPQRPHIAPPPALAAQIQHLRLETQLATIACREGIDLVCNSDISALNALLWYFDSQIEIALLLDPAPTGASPAEALTHLKRIAHTLPAPIALE